MNEREELGQSVDAYEIISNEIEKFEDRMVQQLRSLERRIRDRTDKQLVSARIAAKATGLTEAAIRQSARRGTINKYNANGTRKITNSKTSVFFCLHEINNRMASRRPTSKVAT